MFMIALDFLKRFLKNSKKLKIRFQAKKGFFNYVVQKPNKQQAKLETINQSSLNIQYLLLLITHNAIVISYGYMLLVRV